jgi:hypothetical protein
MPETTKVRFGLQSARELEFEVEDAKAVIEAVEKARDGGVGLVWVTDAKGDRHGIAVDKLAFLEVQGEDQDRGVGF